MNASNILTMLEQAQDAGVLKEVFDTWFEDITYYAKNGQYINYEKLLSDAL